MVQQYSNNDRTKPQTQTPAHHLDHVRLDTKVPVQHRLAVASLVVHKLYGAQAHHWHDALPGGRGYVFALWTFSYTEAYSPGKNQTDWPYSMGLASQLQAYLHFNNSKQNNTDAALLLLPS
jgi:hypothetical protein